MCFESVLNWKVPTNFYSIEAKEGKIKQIYVSREHQTTGKLSKKDKPQEFLMAKGGSTSISLKL
jgi:hypothetical protein